MGRANAASQKGFQGCQCGSWCPEEWGEGPFSGLERTLFDAGSTAGDISMATIQVQVWNHPPTSSQRRANLDPRTVGFTVYMGRYSLDMSSDGEITDFLSCWKLMLVWPDLSGDIGGMGDHKPATLSKSEIDARGGPGAQPVRATSGEEKQVPGLWLPSTRHAAFLFNSSYLPAVWEASRPLLVLCSIKRCPLTWAWAKKKEIDLKTALLYLCM